jgi:hypothetical protein
MPDYVVLGVSVEDAENVELSDSVAYVTCVHEAAQTARPPIEIRSVAPHAPAPGRPGPTFDEVTSGSTGVILFPSRASLFVSFNLGRLRQLHVPVLVLYQRRLRLSHTFPEEEGVRVLTVDRAYADHKAMQATTEAVRNWIERLPRRSAIRPDVATPAEMRALEVFLSAFYRASSDGSLEVSGDDLLTLNVHVDTIQMQLRAPEPSRGVIKAALVDIGVFLLGTATGAAGNYLYSLLPHLR